MTDTHRKIQELLPLVIKSHIDLGHSLKSIQTSDEGLTSIIYDDEYGNETSDHYRYDNPKAITFLEGVLFTNKTKLRK